MTKQQNDVKTFMQTFGQDTPTSPISPIGKTRALRVKLLLEEVLELAAASGVTVRDTNGDLLSDAGVVIIEPNNGPVDLVGVADALADIDYVNQGAAVAYGLNLEPFQDEVHRSNMTKLWTQDEVYVSGDSNGKKLPAGYTATQVGGPGQIAYLVKNADGKVMKSPSYSPADLVKVLASQS